MSLIEILEPLFDRVLPHPAAPSWPVFTHAEPLFLTSQGFR